MVLEIYLDPCTINSRKVLAGLDLIGTDYHYNFINYFEGGQKRSRVRQEHQSPLRQSRLRQDGDLRLTESNAILQYAADLKDSKTYPKDLKERATVNRWLLWEASSWFPSCYIYVVQNVVQPLLGNKADDSVLEGEAPRFNNLASILDDQLGKTKWLAGNEITIADIAVMSPMHLREASKLPLDKYPNLQRWAAEMDKLPSWQKTQGAVDKALLPNKQVRTSLIGPHGGGRPHGSSANISAVELVDL